MISLNICVLGLRPRLEIFLVKQGIGERCYGVREDVRGDLVMERIDGFSNNFLFTSGCEQGPLGNLAKVL